MVQPLPYCVVEYKLHAVKCKAIVDTQKYSKIVDGADKELIGRSFKTQNP